jgi:hypothetical protein
MHFRARYLKKMLKSIGMEFLSHFNSISFVFVFILEQAID